MMTDRCTPDSPCDAVNIMHIIWWGECYIDVVEYVRSGGDNMDRIDTITPPTS